MKRAAATALFFVLAACRQTADPAGPLAGVVLPTPVTAGLTKAQRGLPATVHPRRVQFDPANDDQLLVLESNGDLQIWGIRIVDAKVGDSVEHDAAGVDARLLVVIPGEAVDARFSAGGRAIFSGDPSGAVSLWRRDGQLLWRRETDGKAVRAVAVHGDLLASGNDLGDIHVWRHDGSLAYRRGDAHDGAILSMDFSDGGDVLVSEGADTLLRGWRLRPGDESLEAITSYREADERYQEMLPNLIRWDVQWGWDRSIAFRPGAESFLSCTFGGALQLHAVGGTVLAERSEAHGDHHVRAVAVSPRGDRFASGGLDGSVRLWDAATLDGPTILQGHLRSVSAVDFDRTGRLASAGLDGTVRLWSADGKALGNLPRNKPPDRRRGVGG